MYEFHLDDTADLSFATAQFGLSQDTLLLFSDGAGYGLDGRMGCWWLLGGLG